MRQGLWGVASGGSLQARVVGVGRPVVPVPRSGVWPLGERGIEVKRDKHKEDVCMFVKVVLGYVIPFC